jgi:DNA-binding Lrp family transcriptional regulator
MDNIDKGILNELMKDPKKPFLTIAEKMGIAPVTVQARFEKMKKKGIILGTTTILDLTKIEFQGKAFLFAIASKEYDPETTVESISKIPNVFFISEIMGKFDLLIMVVFHNIFEIREIVKKIRTLRTIDKVEISLTDETTFPIKQEYTKIKLFDK